MAGPFLSKWLRDLFPAHNRQTADPASPQTLARASVSEDKQRELAQRQRPAPQPLPEVQQQAAAEEPIMPPSTEREVSNDGQSADASASSRARGASRSRGSR